AFERWCWIGCKHKCRSLAATTLADYDLPTVLGLTDTEIPCHDDVKRGRPNETCRAKADFSVSGFMFPESSRYGAGAEYSQSVGHFGHNTLGFST
ncbi:MAG: hypothetical protein NTV80_10095, partial [Verrucomicrobia bacterium]|nr:hypothetical protein [Verrucomicrobiota bacterium]